MLTPGRTGLAASVLALGLLAACGDATGPQGVTRDELLGDYMAAIFTTDSAGITIDRLSQGATLYIRLGSLACVADLGWCLADGSTTGHLFLPGGGTGGRDLDADLAGTFVFDESTGRVSFNQPVATFVRDMIFTAGRRDGALVLEGRQSFGGTVIHVVLGQYFFALACRSESGMSAC